MLEVRETDHAGAAVARTAIVAGLKLLETEDALSALRQVRSGGAAHAAEANHDRVEGSHAK